MQTTKSRSKSNGRAFQMGKTQIEKAAGELISDSRKLANALYEDGITRVRDAEDTVKAYSDELLKKVQKNPLTSVLIAAGIGIILAKLMKK